MIRCPGCGGRNSRETLSCEWCRRSFVPSRKRGLSARWWGALSGAVIAMLLLLIGGLALLNATRGAERAPTVAAATATPPPLPPLSIASPSPAVVGAPTAAPQPSPSPPPEVAPSPTPAPRYARITNTGGLGAALRREPSTTAASAAAVAENGLVRLLGPQQQSADGQVWRQVEDERGNQGWVRADLLADAPAPAGR